MNGSILFLALYGILFSLPGWLVWKLLKIRVFPLLFSMAFSYCLLVVPLLIMEWVGASVYLCMAVWSGALVMLAGTVLIRHRHDARGKKVPCGRLLKTGKRSLRRLMPWVVVACVGACVTVYMLYAGPYTEMPADVWAHLGKIQDQFDRLQAGRLPDFVNSNRLFFSQGLHWYWIAAFLCWASGLTLAEAMWPLAWANTLLFALALGSFAWTVVARERISLAAKAWLAGLAVLLTLAHQGVSVFAYFRYYAYAPTMLNYVVYLAVAAVVLRYLRGGVASCRALILLPIFGLTLVTVHTQEALFAFIMCWAIALAYVIVRWSARGFKALFDPSGRRGVAVAGIFTLAYVIGFAWLHLNRPSASEFTVKLISLGALGTWAEKLLIMNPAGDCFQVITLWGCFVYVLALIFWRSLARNPYVAGGMAIPLLTWFNPLTVDMFLRQGSAISVLYRTGYIVPLAFVAAYVMVMAWNALRSSRAFWPVRIGALAALVALILLLWPVRAFGNELSVSRWCTLRRVNASNDWIIWRDLVNQIRSRCQSLIVTDPLTAYIIRPLTGLPCVDKRIWLRASGDIRNDLRQVMALADLPQDFMLIINRRDGSPSETWAKSGHWPSNVLSVSHWYSKSSVVFVETHPECFRELWRSDRIAIYAVNASVLQDLLPRDPVLDLAYPVLLEGPGIRIEWTPVTKKGFLSYHVQCSADGKNWQDLITRREYCYPWLHHQGARTDVFGKWSWCLPSGATYYYRVRAVYVSGPGPWSNVQSATVEKYR